MHEGIDRQDTWAVDGASRDEEAQPLEVGIFVVTKSKDVSVTDGRLPGKSAHTTV